MDPARDIASFVASHRYDEGDFDPLYYMDRFEKDRNSWDQKPYSVREYEHLDKYIPVIDAKRCLAKLHTTKIGCSAAPDCLPDGAAALLDFQALRERRPLTMSKDAPWPQVSSSSSSTTSSSSTSTSSSLPLPDLIRTNTWGIDAKTRRRLLWILERNTSLTEEDRIIFISDVLPAIINTQKDERAHDIRISLHAIRNSCNGNAKHHAAATSLLRYLSSVDAAAVQEEERRSGHRPDRSLSGTSGTENKAAATTKRSLYPFGANDFRVHPKGQGIVCALQQGIPPHTFVSEYIGELYPPWRWYEKTDAVKTIQKRLKKEEALPDFYNITLERHADDKEGTFMLLLVMVIMVVVCCWLLLVGV